MEPHVHLGGVNLVATVCAVVAIFGTAHLLALANPDNRASKAFIALGF